MESVRDRVERAKALHRPKVSNWARDGFATSRRCDVEKLGTDCQTPIPRVRQLEDFSSPCIIQGPPQSMPDLVSTLRLKCGEDDDGNDVRLSVGDFLEYQGQDSYNDDSPLYIFDSRFGDKKWGKPLRRYENPIDAEDLFSLVGERKRPPYRWFLIGPKRSGTCVHVDPLGTAAWNTVFRGRKRWALFPPGTSKSTAKGSHFYDWRTQDDEPINYFVDILPQIRRNHDVMEFIQDPGDTVYVPAGWWHAVLNLDDTVAVTQNFVARENFDIAWTKTVKSRRHLARSWFKRLSTSHPDLARRAVDLSSSGTTIDSKLQRLLRQFDPSSPQRQDNITTKRKKKKHKKHHRKRINVTPPSDHNNKRTLPQPSSPADEIRPPSPKKRRPTFFGDDVHPPRGGGTALVSSEDSE